jgi:hypothetical protein
LQAAKSAVALQLAEIPPASRNAPGTHHKHTSPHASRVARPEASILVYRPVAGIFT